MKVYIKLKSNTKLFFQEIKDWRKLEKFFFLLSVILLFFAFFSTMAFSGRFPLNIVNNVIYFLLIISIIVFVTIYGKFKFDIFFVLLFLFNLSILFSSVFSGFKNFTSTVFLVSITSFFVYQLYTNISDNLKELIITIAFFGGFIFTLYFIIFYRIEIFSFDFAARIGGYFANQNEVSKYFVFLGIFCFYLIIYKRNFYIIPLLFIYLLLILFTGSRSNFIALFTLIMFMIFVKLPKSKKGWFLIISCVGVISFFAILQLDSLAIFKQRFYSMISTLFLGESVSIDNSTYYRIIALKEAIELFFQRPLIGYGFFGTNLYSFNKMSTHNNFASLLGDFGIFAFIFFEALLLIPIILFFRERNDKEHFLILVISFLFYIFIFQFFLINYYTKLEYFLLPYPYSILIKNKRGVSLNFSKQIISVKIW